MVLEELNNLPNEINLIIAYNRLKVSDELIKLNEDIEYSYKDSIFKLIRQSIIYRIDIFSPWNEYLKDLPNIRYWDKKYLIYNPKSECPQNRCLDILYSLDNYIFYKLMFDYNNKRRFSYKNYESEYNEELDRFIKIMEWKSHIKYIKLLKIVDLDNFLRFK